MLWPIGLQFALLSLVSIGGANAVAPEIQLYVADTAHWMSHEDFARLFAIAQAAPGPNVMIFSLIGWHLAGFAGLGVATAAAIVPSSVLAFGAARLSLKYGEASWLAGVKAGLIPLAVGLMLASGIVMSRAAVHGFLAAAITLAATLFLFFTRLNPLFAIAGGAILAIAARHAGLTI